ncbi:hypothetical protein C2G38_2223465 [Gigaspora rosea]|uniref:Uncharacterized protein n=1 Tax=Gigaspora rosea TaxID=44941 RepID=A0A397U5J7_9GLOM|nr:hypothetical protein C2G38_2223465 [Gigaspora rosea]
MNPEIPEERKYIEELTQEYIYLCEELSSKERYKVEGKDIYNRKEISKIKIVSKNLYTAKRLLKRIKILYEAIQEEITRIAVQYYLENNEKLTIYNCFKNNRYYFYFQESEQLSKFINILQEEEPKFLRSITKDYIDLQESNQENNIVEQILSKEELNIKLQGLLDQIKIQIQTLQGQLTLEEAYKNNEYTFLFKRTTAIYKTINGNKPELYSEITTPRRDPRGYLQRIGTPVIIKAAGIVLQTAFGQYTKIILLLENYKSEIVKELSTLETPRLKEYYKTALISISVNQGILEERIKEISTQNIEGEIKELLKPILLNLLENNLMNEEQNKTLEELRRFRFNWQPISTPIRRKKTKRYPRDKDILESRELIQITDDIWETINDLINRINPTNNSRLGAILLILEGAKSIAREFYPHVLEYDKQRPNKIPAHILTRTQTLFPELTGRALVKEQEKQRNIYNNFLDNTQAQIEGIKKRLLAESPEFCKIFEDNPETGETEFYYGDYNNQFTILPFRFHHLILHHLEAIDNILYSEGARNKIYFEEEESYESAYSEINKLSQEFIDKTKKVKELRKEKERLEQATDKIINRILLENNKPIEKPKRTRSNSL